jgi:hypothetical protein
MALNTVQRFALSSMKASINSQGAINNIFKADEMRKQKMKGLLLKLKIKTINILRMQQLVGYEQEDSRVFSKPNLKEQWIKKRLQIGYDYYKILL